MDLAIAVVGFILVAFLWAMIMFFALKIGYRVKKRSLMLVLFYFVALCVIVLIIGFLLEYVDQPEFCGTACHPRAGLIVDDTPMKSFYETYTDPGNNTIMETHASHEVKCANCHEKPGVTGKIEAYYSAGVEMFAYLTGNYDMDDLGGAVGNENCLKCHDGTESMLPGEVISVDGSKVNPHNSDELCSDCHRPHQEGIGLSADACVVCHDVSPAELSNHGSTTQMECMECHNMDHPDDASLSFLDFPGLSSIEFCGDCHREEFDVYSNWSTDQKSIYGDCKQVCHTRHKTTEYPHKMDLPYGNSCDSCHPDDFESHVLENISFKNFKQKPGIEFCGDCHEYQFNIFNSWTDMQRSFYGNCSSCHGEHKVSFAPHNVRPPYKDNCEGCHVSGVGSHELNETIFWNFKYDIPNDFCGNCHTDQQDTLKSTNHSSRNCVDCHGEHHREVVSFDRCDFCHSEIPPRHEESKGGCSDCHNMESIHPK